MEATVDVPSAQTRKDDTSRPGGIRAASSADRYGVPGTPITDIDRLRGEGASRTRT